MTPPQHICPKCHETRAASDFINAKGKPAKWCCYCRAAYRERLTTLHQRDATKPKREEAISIDAITKQEGYANHPLATLLALSHIAGAKRALAIRDGSSWRGKKAWRAYYEAKRTLETMLIEMETEDERQADLDAEIAAEREFAIAMDGIPPERDPNSSGVS